MTPDQFMRMFSPQPWMEHAVCRVEGIDVNVMVPPRPKNAVKDKRAVYRTALEVCARCPVSEQCGEYGKDERFGTWGGTTPYDRDPRRQVRYVPCDTVEGYWRHMRDGTEPCGPCKRRYATSRAAYEQHIRESA